MLKNRATRIILFNCGAAFFLVVIFFIFLELVIKWSELGIKVIDKEWVQENISYNKDGFRDRNYSSKKPEDVFRILIIGDSQTFGHGINRLYDTYPKKLETSLNLAAGSKKFEVLSFARPGWNSDSYVQYLYKKGLDYEPDLIILSLYHNDILPPAYFDCDSSDFDLVDSPQFLSHILKKIAIYNFLKFRINRVLEALDRKPNYIQCRKKIYNSRGWDMQRIYLDTIIGTAKKNNIHFIMTIIPVLFKLGDNYPMRFAHNKLKIFCDDRNLDCYDFFEKGFKGLNTRNFIISENDRHLNEKGSELIAKLLYDFLKPLVKIKGLERFHRAFNFQELLERGSYLKKISTSLKKLNSPDATVSTSTKDFQLVVFKNVEQYSFLKTLFNPKIGKRKTLRQINLDKRGKFLSLEAINYHSIDDKFFRKEKWINTERGKELKVSLLRKRGNVINYKDEFYPFRYVSKFDKNLDKFIWSLEIRRNEFFIDPFTLENSIFYPERAILERPKGEEIFRALIFYKDFYFYEKSGKSYSDSLAREIIDRKPYPEAVRASKKYLQISNEVLEIR